MSYAPLYSAQAMSRRYNVLERAAGRAGVRSERNPKRLSGETHNKAALSPPEPSPRLKSVDAAKLQVVD